MSGTSMRFVRHLDPIDAMEEFLFGLIMVLTFTLGAGVVVKEGPDATKEMLLGILGCNVAWGIIDGVMYVMSCLLERSRKARLLRSLQGATDERDAVSTVRSALDDRLAPLTSAEERAHLYGQIVRRLKGLSPETTRVKRDDVLGAGVCFVLVVMSTIPAILPFLLIRDRFVALRVSNALLLALLFFVGYRWARAAQANAWLFASSLTFVGLVLVGIAMSLGG